MVNHGMSLGEAVNVFTKLTIGDGLVSQVPAFLISLAAGLIVTRSSSETDLGRDVTGQLFGRRAVLAVAAVLPGPAGVHRAAEAAAPDPGRGARRGGDLARGTERRASRSEPEGAAAAAESRAGDRRPRLAAGGRCPRRSGWRTCSTSIRSSWRSAIRLIGLADPTRGGDLLDRLRTVRQRVARDLGLIVPQVRIHDEIGLGPHEYRLKIRGTVVGQGIAYAGRLLAVPPAGLVTRPDGRDGVDPVTGQPAVWIHADGREVAELAGCRDPRGLGGRRRPLRRDRARPRRRADDPRAGRAAARPGPGHVADPGRRGRARACSAPASCSASCRTCSASA